MSKLLCRLKISLLFCSILTGGSLYFLFVRSSLTSAAAARIDVRGGVWLSDERVCRPTSVLCETVACSGSKCNRAEPVYPASARLGALTERRRAGVGLERSGRAACSGTGAYDPELFGCKKRSCIRKELSRMKCNQIC